MTEFWYYEEIKSNKTVPRIDNHKFVKFMSENNIFKYYTDDIGQNYIFIKRKDKFINEISVALIKDFVLDYVENNVDIWNLLTNKLAFFSPNSLNMLETGKINVAKDTKEYAFLYYQNACIKVTKDKFELIKYDNLDGYVWENTVIKRDFVQNGESEGEYKRFMWLVSNKNKQRYYTIKSVIGYLLHGYKDPSTPKAIIFNDEMISDVPNGGSGKGLFHKAIKHIKKVDRIDGKSFNFDKPFLYQHIHLDTQLVYFDDVNKGFSFEKLFSVITEGMTIEKKGKDPIVLNYEDSPKITITTNYTIKDNGGGSEKRRKFEVEFSNYFNDNHQPETEFKHQLFTDWNDNEWAKFDNFMLRCVQYYLRYGLVESKHVNLELRKLIDKTNKAFIDFMDDYTFTDNMTLYKKDFKEEFVKSYDDFNNSRFKTHTFNSWVKLYFKYKKIDVDERNSGGSRAFIIKLPKGFNNKSIDDIPAQPITQSQPEEELPF